MVLAAASLWGTLGIYGRLLFPMGYTPLELASVRTVVGLAGLAGLMVLRGRRTARTSAGRRIQLAAAAVPWADLPFFAVYGLVSVAVFQYVYFEAIERTTVPIAAALLYTAPAFVVVLAWVFLGEPLRRGRLLALAMVLLGVLLVTGAGRSAAAGVAPLSLSALLFGLAAGLTYALNTIFGKRALRRHDPYRTVFFIFVFGAIFLALAAPPWEPLARRLDALPLLLALGLLPTLAAYLLYIGGLRHLPAGNAAILATAEPVVAALVGAFFLAEALRWDQAAGVALILGAALLLSRRPTM